MIPVFHLCWVHHIFLVYIHFLGHPHFWGRLHFCGSLHFWGWLYFWDWLNFFGGSFLFGGCVHFGGLFMFGLVLIFAVAFINCIVLISAWYPLDCNLSFLCSGTPICLFWKLYWPKYAMLQDISKSSGQKFNFQKCLKITWNSLNLELEVVFVILKPKFYKNNDFWHPLFKMVTHYLFG